jgi:hypothetical protein
MADGFIVRRGGKAEVIEKAETPTINFVSSTTTSITFTIKNNDAQTAVILWERDDTTPDANSLELTAGATSSNLTISGLTEGTLLTIYATANVTDKIKSNVAELVRGTTLATPTITQVSKTTSSITFTVRNNSNQAADVTYGLTSPPTTTTVALNANTTSANQTISGLADDTQFTVFAETKKANHTNSAIASSTVTTDKIIVYTAATGGTTNEYNASGKRFRSHTFTSNGTFTVTTVGDNIDDRNKVDYLIIAGGGGGGRASGAGGGAGGYRTTNGTSGANSSAQTKVTVTAQSYSITVGGGGAGSANNNVKGSSGTNSTALGITSTGGGGGGTGNDQLGLSGGSGGGSGGIGTGTYSGGSGTSGQGRNGGNGTTNETIPVRSFGGGGGASGLGQNGSTSTFSAGNGGSGLNNLLRTGSAETRAGGGGAGGGATSPSYSAGTGGSGGGGNGGTGATTANATAGATNTGSGGGGGGTRFGVADYNGAAGGSGIVVIRYEIATV